MGKGCKWIRCLVCYSCMHHDPFIIICVCVCGSTQERIVLMSRMAGIYISKWPGVCVSLWVPQCMYKNMQADWPCNRITLSVGPLLLTSFIGRGGHLRGWGSEGESQAFCQAWQAGGPRRVLTAPSKVSLTLVLVSLPCIGLYGRCGSGWPNGSSEHLRGAFQQHKEQQQSLSG